MDVKQKQHAFIEFLLLEGVWITKSRRVSRMCTARMRLAGCPCSDAYKWLAEGTRSFGMRDVPGDHLDMKSMRASGQFYRTTRTLRCEESGRSRRIPHTPRSELKQTRVTMCMQLLSKLRAHAHNNWHSLVTPR
jgi:hypothetical protein